MSQTSTATIHAIERALLHGISADKSERDESYRFLVKECEPNPAFQLALLHIIENRPDQNAQLQKLALICMKNSLTRLLSQHRSRSRRSLSVQAPQSCAQAQPGVKQVGFTCSPQAALTTQQQMTEEMRGQIKDKLLQFVQESESKILGDQAFEQLTLVVGQFIKYDFPAQWPQLNTWLLKSFDQLHASLPNLQAQDVPKIKRFLGFYLDVVTEQSRKKLNMQKTHFYKIGKDYLKVVAKVWAFFNAQQQAMVMNSETQQLQLQNFSEPVFEIACKLDKVLIMVVSCGFSLNNLPQDPEMNPYVETTAQLLQKLKFFITAVGQVNSQLPASAMKQQYMSLLEAQVKTFLKHLSELQHAQTLLMFNTLDQFLQQICQVLGSSDVYSARVCKLAMIALYRIINTQEYNQNTVGHDLEPHQNGIGILVSPVKLKNFQPLIEQAASRYQKVMQMPTPPQDDQPASDHQDGARKLLELITNKFLCEIDFQSWQSDPEYFIEHEDEQFLIEYDLKEDCSLNLLAMHLIEKLLQKFYSICYPYIQEILGKYFSQQMQIPEKIEDALLNLVGIVGKVQREYKVSQEKRLDVCYVLKYIHQYKWEQPIFKRRYLLIITHWAKILPKVHFFEIFQSVLTSLGDIKPETAAQPLQQVLIFEHCHCIHEMLKEISNWLQRAEQLKKGRGICTEALPKDIGELRSTHNFTDSEEDQITLSQLIDSQLSYSGIFQNVCSHLTVLLDVYRAPTLIWQMINWLSFILEKNCDQPDATIECLRSLNILKILQGQNKSHVDEAIIDMLKNLLCQVGNSQAILEMCCLLLDYQLARSLNDSTAVKFWQFTMRACNQDNQGLPQLKALFVKFSGCLTQTNQQVQVQSSTCAVIKKDFIYVEFLKVAQEAVLLGMFQSQEELLQLMQFVTFKFSQEVEREKASPAPTTTTTSSYCSSDSADSEGECGGSSFDTANNEKKMYLVQIAHIMFWQVQANQNAADFIFNYQKPLIAQCCLYLVESKTTLKAKQSSANFFTELITYLNRMIVVKPQELMAILSEVLQSKSIQVHTWVEQWIRKTDFLVSQEAKRIACLAVYTLLPYFPAQIVRVTLPEIARQTVNLLEQFLYLKLTNNKSRFHSPSRMNNLLTPHLIKNTNAVKLRIFDKMSQRYEDLKRADELLDLDLIEHFWAQIRQMAQNLGADTGAVVSCIGDQSLRADFQNLMDGISPRYNQLMKERQQQDLNL